jgi:Putative peptidoglycan binding domain
MKQIILLFLILNVRQILGQNILQLPLNANPTRKYAKCLIPDSAHRNVLRGSIPPYSWDEYLLEKTPKLQRFKIELPVFDTNIVKIPVDKVTRMANLPDEYGLINEKIKVNESSYKWIIADENKECLSCEPDNCFIIGVLNVPAEYKLVRKRVLKSTAHQQRYEDKDTVLIKQIIEIKPLEKIPYEVPPQYEKVFMKQNPYASYTEWRQILCSDNERSEREAFILKIQKSLKARGYYQGALDKIFGEKTKAAMMQFQKDNNFEFGIMNKEALEMLEAWIFVNFD